MSTKAERDHLRKLCENNGTGVWVTPLLNELDECKAVMSPRAMMDV